MNGSFLLDTNIVIAVFANEEAVLQRLIDAAEVFVPSMVLGELYYGAQKSGRPTSNIARIDEFAADTAILDCDLVTAKFYGEIKNSLRAKGRPLPENDIWIASVAKQHKLKLVTRDGHFHEIEELLVEAW